MKISNFSLSRRQLLKASSLTGASFILGVTLPLGRLAHADSAHNKHEGINAFIAIHDDGSVTFQNPFIEMGQGTYTSIPSIMAEELDVNIEKVIVVQAPHGDDYKIMFGNTLRFTGGSFSVRSSYDTIRKAGATARAMLIEAAASIFKVPASECTTKPGIVVHSRSKREMDYGKLASIAAKLPVPSNVELKDQSEFRLIGKSVKRTDTLSKSTGAAKFGIDTQVEGMKIALIKQSPVFGGKVKSFDKTVISSLPGVYSVDQVGNGVAVIADNFWNAKSALAKLPIEFENASYENFSSENYLKTLRSRLNENGVEAENIGDAAKVITESVDILESEYHAPFLAHATMEPMNATVLVEEDLCTAWAPNQGADWVAQICSEVTGLPLEKIVVNTPYLGGGFGRRFVLDYLIQAVSLAAIHKGIPIKVVWTREDDTQHDHYRPMTAAKYRAAFDDSGLPVALHITTAGEGPMGRLNPQFLQNPDIDVSIIEGAYEQPYAIPNKRMDLVNVPVAPIPICYWRSVGNSHNSFFKESFIDEMAHKVRKDPLEFRISLLSSPETQRYRNVLETVAKMSDWRANSWLAEDGKKHALGVALQMSFETIVAEVAEVSLEDDELTVHKVWCAVDCGFAINPTIVKMQMESGIAFGLSAALAEEVTIEGGKCVQANFDSYPILTPDKMPKIEVEIINSGAALGGIGEPGTPPIAPAVCNALYTLTGKRIRSLPISKHLS
jgi:isoquinoline 1-oxidoreductase beta subunit